MGFLLMKIVALLGLAAACGAGAAYWWFRRHYEDVTLEYARTREDWDAWRRSFEERLGSRPAVNLEPVAQQLAGLQVAVSAIEIPAPADLTPLHARLEELTRRVEALRIPEPPDLSSTDQRLTAIEHALFPVQTRLDELTGALRALRVASAAADSGLGFRAAEGAGARGQSQPADPPRPRSARRPHPDQRPAQGPRAHVA